MPAIGQGIVGIECREEDARTREWLAPLHDATSAIRLAAERSFNARLGGACQAPIAGHATQLADGRWRLVGLVGTPDGATVLRDEISGPAHEAEQLGIALAERLLAAGAEAILRGLEPVA